MKKTLYILRGIPGCGKSTVAQTLTKAVCTADDYFTHGGEYNWSVDKIGTAHMWCQRKCRRFMKANVERIAIANTNVTTKDMKPYYDMANEYGYMVVSLIVENRHGGVNTHNVPQTVIENMKSKFDVKL